MTRRGSPMIGALILVLGLLALPSTNAESATVIRDLRTGGWQVIPGLHPRLGYAWGTYEDDVETTGWGRLEIFTPSSPQAANKVQREHLPHRHHQSYAAGLLEAYFTHTRMYQYWYNYAQYEYKGLGPSIELQSFMKEQMVFIKEGAKGRTDGPDKFWPAIADLMEQFQGLVDGYQAYASPGEPMSELELYMLNSVGDLEDFNELFSPDGAGAGAFPPQATQEMDCSALIKVLPKGQDIVFGHTTWRSYYAMLRAYKVYHLPGAPAYSFSSSPGLLHSKDDFYVLGSGLLVMETTNSVFNTSLYDSISPQTVLTWQRVTAANLHATSGKEWVETFAFLNSGSYNNQWMVLDAKRFDPTDGLNPHRSKGLLWIIEQIPGRTHAGDVTPVLLQQGYWASYNVPYFNDIFYMSGYGYPKMVDLYGDLETYDKNPRAQIFAREASKVQTLEGVKRIMQYNEYQTDPLSMGIPQWSISARADLPPTNSSSHYKIKAFGGVDSKVSSVGRVLDGSLLVDAMSGPTHQGQIPFTWDDPRWDNISHIGLPKVFDFDWIQVGL